MVSISGLLAVLAVAASIALAAPTTPAAPVFTTACNGKAYAYNELAGYGFLPHDARDKFGDSISLGSSIAFASWKKQGSKYVGKMYGLPDRGWNTQGTVNFQPRIHSFTITLTPAPDASASSPSTPNVAFEYKDTILLMGPDGLPTTGLDPDQTGGLTYPGFPTLPAATFPGDGFEGAGPGGHLVCLDTEALFLGEDGSFWISDEYGPYIYKFNKNGKLVAAIAPPDAILPLRNGTVSFASDNPPRYDPNKHPVPSNPTQGRQNNQGFEGMTVSPNGKNLYVLLQSAARQEGGKDAGTRQYTRLLRYSIKGCASSGHGAAKKREITDVAPVFRAEYVVPLPTFVNSAGQTRIAAQSEMHFISDTQFFFLPRDSGAGHGLASSTSLYRHVDIIDISAATNVKGPTHDAFNASISSSAGVLNADITPAVVCPFLDFNINAQLSRFGLHNGGAQDATLLNEKWEGLALVPVTGDAMGSDPNGEYFLFAASDNDFISQNGAMNFGQIPFQDASGFNVDNQMLVFKVTLPQGSKPLVG